MYSGIVVVFEQKWFLIGQIGIFSGNVVVFGQNDCIRAKCLYSGKVVVFGQNVSIRAKWLYFGKLVCMWAKAVVIGQIGLYLDKIASIRAKLLC